MMDVPITPGDILDSVSHTHAHGPHAGIVAAYFPQSSFGDPPGSPFPSSEHFFSAALNHEARWRMAASTHAAEFAAMRQVVAELHMQLHAVLIERSGAIAGGTF